MRFLRASIIILLLTFAGVGHAAKKNDKVHPVSLSPQTIAKVKQPDPPVDPCSGGTASRRGADVCRIDVGVTVDVASKTCTVTVPEKVVTKPRHLKVEWVVTSPPSTYDVTFSDFPSIAPILMRDDKYFKKRKFGATKKIYEATIFKKGGTYYYIFLQWSDPSVEGGAAQYCAVVDPIIYNDDDPTIR